MVPKHANWEGVCGVIWQIYSAGYVPPFLLTKDNPNELMWNIVSGNFFFRQLNTQTMGFQVAWKYLKIIPKSLLYPFFLLLLGKVLCECFQIDVYLFVGWKWNSCYCSYFFSIFASSMEKSPMFFSINNIQQLRRHLTVSQVQMRAFFTSVLFFFHILSNFFYFLSFSAFRIPNTSYLLRRTFPYLLKELFSLGA